MAALRALTATQVAAFDKDGVHWIASSCVQHRRGGMLDSIRTIVSGRVEPVALVPNAAEELHSFAAGGRRQELVANLRRHV